MSVIVLSCSAKPHTSTVSEVIIRTIQDIPVPTGFQRKAFDSIDFGYYLRNLPIKKDEKVRLYNGDLKWNQHAHYAVVQMDIGTKDLQQCADATMRLRGEHLFAQKRFGDIAFHFTSGHLATWLQYSKGYRPKITGNQVSFILTAKPDNSYTSFRKYMDLIFTYCGTASMKQDVKQKALKDLKAGDVFLQSKQPYGHAITVMDVAEDSLGNRIFLIAQSYMPAQNIHILVNPGNKELSPWFTLKTGETLETPEWTFPANSLYGWK